MVEPLFLKNFESTVSVGQTVLLDGDEGKHAASVRRMRVGEAIALTDGFGVRVRGRVSAVELKSLSVLVESIEQEELPALQLTLVQALAKGDRDELAIQAATELGVTHVVPWQADRSISRWNEVKAAKGQARWQQICDEAAKQSLRSWFVQVDVAVSTKQLASQLGRFDRVLVLDPTAPQGIASLGALSGKVAIVVGPEGGIDEVELALLEQAGAQRVRLGASILRTSTAGIVAIAALQAATGQFD